MRLTEEQRRERLAPVERELRHIAYPPPRDPSQPLVIGNAPFRPNPVALRVNAQALVEGLDALRAENERLRARVHELEAANADLAGAVNR